MMRTSDTKRKNRTIALAAAGVMLAVPLAACGGSDDPAGTSTATSSTPEPSMSSSDDMESDMAMDAPFGSACADVPTEGEGSVDGMADDPVATAASNNPLLSTLVKAVGAAKLVDTLNSAEDITVFAPTNDAFEAMDPATLKKAMGDPDGLLKTVLTYHVVEGKLAPADLAGTHTTLQGDDLTVEGSGEDFTVNGEAMVVCGNVQTANATVYLVDQVLMPPM
jgi:uncharacterized surface protein with fasciclin (FAS1) repeats